jgi:hypothetical protein
MKMVLAVLATCGCIAATSVSVAKSSAPHAMGGPAKLHCSGHGDAESMTMEEAEATPIYKMVQGKAGDPQKCVLGRGGESESFTVSFAKGVTILYTDDEKNESSNTEVALPAGSAAVSQDEAVQVLKAEEKEDNPKGVGMDWATLTAPAPTGDADVVASGKKCNARTHIKYSAGAVVGFGLSSACQEE